MTIVLITGLSKSRSLYHSEATTMVQLGVVVLMTVLVGKPDQEF